MTGPQLNLTLGKKSVCWNMGGGCETGRDIEVDCISEGKVLFHDHPDPIKLRMIYYIYYHDIMIV